MSPCACRTRPKRCHFWPTLTVLVCTPCSRLLACLYATAGRTQFRQRPPEDWKLPLFAECSLTIDRLKGDLSEETDRVVERQEGTDIQHTTQRLHVCPAQFHRLCKANNHARQHHQLQQLADPPTFHDLSMCPLKSWHPGVKMPSGRKAGLNATDAERDFTAW